MDLICGISRFLTAFSKSILIASLLSYRLTVELPSCANKLQLKNDSIIAMYAKRLLRFIAINLKRLRQFPMIAALTDRRPFSCVRCR
jgi:hypothetical protein